ncbi:hypothetical protein GCM10009785_06650 [Brooklawnia cerclae]|uniref:DUF2029 domain-containing protein n=1 Tax=Brooklawnia cerclae TaxID=349934 RepID=A0ABX0SDD7_9ACTN|nr:glycosyltransferase 87 family protein [Brooklawnia cerclae]NIH56412.1 hypothetical protein [Brooklawnia cerclae]
MSATAATARPTPPVPAASQSGRAVAALASTVIWLLSRAVMGVLWYRREQFIDNDVRYYLWQSASGDIGSSLVEYPTPIAVFLGVLARVAGSSENTYVATFVALMFLLDAAATIWLWTRFSRRAATYWATFTFLVGSLIWFRIDLIPAVTVLAGLVWLNRRPGSAGAAVALGAATKLWPAVLVAPMLGVDRPGRRRGLGFLAAGGALGLVSLLLFGWERSASPLVWQSDRGLQIESIPATWLMALRAFHPDSSHWLELSQYNAWEIYGPGVDAWLVVADVLMGLFVVLAVVLAWFIALGGAGLPGHSARAAADPERSMARTHAIVLAQTALICAVMVANKTFSPQYMIWLSGPLAVLVTLPVPRRQRIEARWLGGLGLVVAALTQLVFPLGYGGILADPPHVSTTLLLVGRNLLMIILTVATATAALREAWRLGSVG